LTGPHRPLQRDGITGEVLAPFEGRAVLGRPTVSAIWLLGLFLGEGEWPKFVGSGRLK